jgi:putative heme-binding domain-containing protein
LAFSWRKLDTDPSQRLLATTEIPMLNKISPWGLAAFCLAVLGLLLASVVHVRVPTLALAVLGLLTALLGLAVSLLRRQTGSWPWLLLGGTLSGAVLSVALVAPGWLNPRWADAGPVEESDPDQLVLIPRDPKQKERPLAEDDWVDAATEMIRQDDMLIQVKSAQVGRLPEKPDAPVLLVHLQARQSRPGRAIPFFGFGKGKPQPQLTDDSGRLYTFKGNRTKRFSKAFDVDVRNVEEWLAFELPPKEIEAFKLAIPAAAWGRNGMCRFRIRHIDFAENERTPRRLRPNQIVSHVKQMVLDPKRPPPDLSVGRLMFFKTCFECHTLFGVGNKVGPDLTTSKRDDLDFLLTSIIFPSAEIAKGFEPWVLTTVQGKVFSGLIKDPGADPLVVQTGARASESVPRKDIDELNPSRISLMPTELLKGMSDHEVRSLVAYLSGKEQVRMLVTPEYAQLFFVAGPDIAGWHGTSGPWKVVKGEFGHEIVALPPKAGFSPAVLTSDMVVEDDFQLTVRVRLEEGAKGAILIGAEDKTGPPRSPVRIEMTGGGPVVLRTSDGQVVAAAEGVTAADDLQAGSWKKLEIEVTGQRLHVRFVWLDGKEIKKKEIVTMANAELPARRVIAVEGPDAADRELRFANLDLFLPPAKK